MMQSDYYWVDALKAHIGFCQIKNNSREADKFLFCTCVGYVPIFFSGLPLLDLV